MGMMNVWTILAALVLYGLKKMNKNFFIIIEKKNIGIHIERRINLLFLVIVMMLNYHTAAEYVKHNYKYKFFCRKFRAFII